MIRRTLVVLALVLVAPSLAADAPDAELIARVTGVRPDVKGGVAKISVPRSDLTVTVDSVKLQPFQGLTSWAAFQVAGKETVVMGDLTLAEDEVSAAMDAALANGLEVTALHNHFAFDSPRAMFMHVAGHGTTEALARGVRKTLDAVAEVRRRGAPAAGFDGPTIPSTSGIDPKPLETILGAKAQAKDGMVKFVIERWTRAHGIELGADMGVNTWAAFGGSSEAAVVDGDFAVLESELQAVLKVLRVAKINVVAIHSHMTHEDPRIMFLHYWSKGPAEDLARGLKRAFDAQGRS